MTVSAVPGAAELVVGESLTLTLTVIDPRGRPTAPPALASSAPAVASLSGEVVTALVPGTSLIQYQTAVGPITVSTITVVALGTAIDSTTPASLWVSPPLMALAAGSTRAIQAQVSSLAATSVPATLAYSSVDPTVASVDGSGTVTGVAPGITAIVVYLPRPLAGLPDAGAASSLAAVSTQVGVEVLLPDGGEPINLAGGCPQFPDGGQKPVPVSCSFPHSPYQILVGMQAQMEPVQITYACPYSVGFTSDGYWSAWTENVVGFASSPRITPGGVVTADLCETIYAVDFSPNGSTRYAGSWAGGTGTFCPNPAFLYSQPNFTGAWTCQWSPTCQYGGGPPCSVDAGIVMFTGAPVDQRAICPLTGDPTCCSFTESNIKDVTVADTGVVRYDCSTEASTVVPGSRTIPINGFECSLGAYEPNAFCVEGLTYTCEDAGAGQDAGSNHCADGTSLCCNNGWIADDEVWQLCDTGIIDGCFCQCGLTPAECGEAGGSGVSSCQGQADPDGGAEFCCVAGEFPFDTGPGCGCFSSEVLVGCGIASCSALASSEGLTIVPGCPDAYVFDSGSLSSSSSSSGGASATGSSTASSSGSSSSRTSGSGTSGSTGSSSSATSSGGSTGPP